MPNYEVTSPTGKKYQVSAPEGATQDQVLAYAQGQFGKLEQPAAPPTPPPQQEKTWGNAIKNVGEAGLHLGSSMLGGIAGDVAGLGALISPAAMVARHYGANIDPAQIRDKVSNALTYEPSNPDSLSNKIGTFPGRVLGSASDFLKEKVTNAGGVGAHPYLGDLAGATPLVAANLLGLKGAKLASRAAAAPAEAIVPTMAEEAAQKAASVGYKITPTQVNAKIGSAVEGMVGQPKLERSLSISNAKVTDNLAKKYLGVPDTQELTPKLFDSIRSQENRAYEQVAKTGTRKTSDAFREEIANIDDRSGAGSFAEDTPEAVQRIKRIYGNVKFFSAKDGVAKIRQLRADASKNIKALNDPEKNALGNAQRKVAAALDNELARHVETLGKPELSSAYQAARVRLAKLHTIEDAMQGTNVSAKKIWQQRERGVPIGGDLGIVADTYGSFGKVLQDISKIRHSGPFSVVDYVLGVGGAVHSPALAAAIAARPLARAVLASKTYQRSLTKPAAASASKASKSLATAAQTTPLLTEEAEQQRRAAK